MVLIIRYVVFVLLYVVQILRSDVLTVGWCDGAG